MEQPTPRPSSEQTKAILADRGAARAEEHEQNRQDIIAHLKERGLRSEAIAAIVGNIAVETGGSFKFDQMQTRSGDPYDPNTVRFGGYGLFQFDDYSPGQGHRSWYQEYLKDNEKTDSLESQLDYVLDTIFSDSQDTNYKYTERLGVSDAGTLKAYLQTNTDPEQISDAFVDRFEKAGIPHSSRRRDAAMKTFAELSPSDRADISPDDQFLDQPGEIRDTGKVDNEQLKIVDVPEEKSTYEKIKPYVPILRHFNEGGMALEKQMELFEDGGLKDDGGTTDPVSGNDVPPGSTQEEVRDDIPAQLSEGEFVFPADVVRYIGLEKLMKMRQEAKMGLRMMEDMGQMGNSDEAVMPDDIPFDLSDLDMDDDLEYNVGGFVPGQSNPFGIAGTQQSAFAGGVGGYTPYQMPQYGQTPMAQAYTPAQQQFVPTQPVPTTLPTPQQFLPNTPTDPEVTTKEYINPETGEKRVITFVGGQPTIAIPPGFITVEEYEKTQPPATEVAPTTTPTTRVVERDDSGDERRRKEEEAKYGPGGGRIGLGGMLDPDRPGYKTGAQIVGVSFNMPGGLPGVGAVLGTAAGLVSGEGIPESATATFFRDGRTVTVSADKYNRMKKAGFMGKEADQLLKDVSGQSAKEAKEARLAMAGAEEQIKEAKEAREEFESSFKDNSLVVDRKTGAIKAKPGASAAEKAKAEQAILDYAASMATDDDEDDGGGTPSGGGRTESAGADWSAAQESVSTPSSSGDPRGYSMRAEGGLMQKDKPKPKAKKMKRGGLASKK